MLPIAEPVDNLGRICIRPRGRRRSRWGKVWGRADVGLVRRRGRSGGRSRWLWGRTGHRPSSRLSRSCD